MIVVFDSGRKRIGLGREIGGGGEATVYEVAGQPDLLAKIYNPSPRPGYDQKLAWMLAHPPDHPTRVQGHASIVWPLDLLYDDRRQFVGYLMPYIRNAVPLLDVLNPRCRAQTLPGFNWKYLHRTARNLASALGALHARGYVVGDLNESNVMVTPSVLVAMIDTDSFQVQEQIGARLVIYPCPVGKLEYTPPELQGRDLQATQQLPEHDCFGLGVLIFQLLMEGSHPFRARWLGSGDPPPVEERIRQGCFPYIKPPPCPVAPPRTLSLDVLHPRVVGLVRRCFVDGHHDPRQRPTAGEWERAIAEAEQALVSCRNGHYYSSHLSTCPRCRARGTGTPVPKPARRPARATLKYCRRSGGYTYFRIDDAEDFYGTLNSFKARVPAQARQYYPSAREWRISAKDESVLADLFTNYRPSSGQSVNPRRSQPASTPTGTQKRQAPQVMAGARPVSPTKQKRIPARTWTVGALGVLAIVAIVFAVPAVVAVRYGKSDGLAATTAAPTLASSIQPPTLAPLIQPPTLTSAATPSPVDTLTRQTDDTVMVYVPAGEFEMGSDDAAVDYALVLCNEHYGDCEREWYENEQPVHTVALGAFWIDRTEVTNAQYAKCVTAGACEPPARSGSHTHDSYYSNSTYDDYPVIYVDWEQAAGYCSWAGGRLPTEAEWEFAARGSEGRLYPWGDGFDGTRVNYCDANCEFAWADERVDDGYADTAPVRSYRAGESWCGALGMAGNVWEWVADWYGPYPSGRQVNPKGPPTGDRRVVRGGSWNNTALVRAAYRFTGTPINIGINMGFRCAMDSE